MKYVVSKFGKYYYFDQDTIGATIAKGEFWDVHYRPWIEKLNSNTTFVDVGANIGFFTIYAALKGAWVWAFEASPEVFEVLKRNVEENNLGLQVKLANFALYDCNDSLMLNPEWNYYPKLADGKINYEAIQNAGGMSLILNTVPGGGVYDIPCRTLDSYNLWKCDMIKIDTQGADGRVIKGAERTIKKFHPVILFEVEPEPARLHGDSHESVIKMLCEWGYTIMEVAFGGFGAKDYVAYHGQSHLAR